MVAAGIGVALAPTLALEGIRPGVNILPLQPRPPSAASSWSAWPATRSPPPP